MIMWHLIIHLFIAQLDHVSLHQKTFYDMDFCCWPSSLPVFCSLKVREGWTCDDRDYSDDIILQGRSLISPCCSGVHNNSSEKHENLSFETLEDGLLHSSFNHRKLSNHRLWEVERTALFTALTTHLSSERASVAVVWGRRGTSLLIRSEGGALVEFDMHVWAKLHVWAELWYGSKHEDRRTRRWNVGAVDVKISVPFFPRVWTWEISDSWQSAFGLKVRNATLWDMTGRRKER